MTLREESAARKEIREAFQVARHMDPEERAAYLAERLGDDPDRIREVEELLATDPAEEESPLDGEVGGRLFGEPGPAPPRPENVGPYRVLDTLGEGGMGIVYLAEEERPLHRTVAVKVLRPGLDSRSFLRRFENERQLLVRLDHPSIARVLDAGSTEDGRPYLALEFVPGLPLNQHCERYGVGFEERIELFLQVCEAVQHAHEKGIIHRDLKPSNILVSYASGDAVPKVIDFGVAKALVGPTEAAITRSGQMIGTPEYMAPEQADSAGRDVDTRSDVYALGVLLYELLTGSLPLDGEELRTKRWSEVVRLLRTSPPRRPSEVVSPDAPFPGPEGRRALAQELDWVLLKCLEKDRALRYASADALREDLRRFLDDVPVSAGPPKKLFLARKFVRRHRTGVRFVAVLFLALLGGLLATASQAHRAEREQRRAEEEAASQRLILEVLTDLLSAVDPWRPKGYAPPDREVTVTDVFERMNEEVGRRFEGSPLEEATIRHTLGLGFLQLGEYEQALSNLKRSLELHERVLPEDDRRAALSEAALGHALCVVNGPDAGVRALEAGVERLRALDPEDPATVQAERWLVHATWDTVRGHQLAEERYERVRGLYGQRSHESIQALLDATFARYHFDVEGSQRAFAELETLVEEYYGSPAHPEAVALRGSYADFLSEIGRNFEALPIYEEVYANQLASLGPDAPRTLAAASSLAGCLTVTGEVDRGVELSADCVRRARTLSPVDSWITVFVTAAHANCILRANRVTECLSLLEETRRLCPRTLQSDPFWRMRFDRLQAFAYENQNRLEEAEALLLECVEWSRANAECTPRDRADAVYNLINFYLTIERSEEAVRFARESVAIVRAEGGSAESGYFEHEQVLVHALMQNGELSEARRLLKELLEVMRASASEKDLVEALHVFAALCYQERAFAEAAEHLSEIEVIYTRWYGEENESTLLVRQQIGSVRAEQGDHEGADRLLSEVEAACRLHIAEGRDGLQSLLDATLSKRGRSLHALGRNEEAEALLEECLPGLADRYSFDNERITVVVDALAEIYTETGRSDEATELRARYALEPEE